MPASALTTLPRRRWAVALFAAGAALLVLAGCTPAASEGLKNDFRRHESALPQRPGWIDSVPADAAGNHFLVGLSEHHSSERDAREDAMRDAREQFAKYTGVDMALVDEVVRSLYGSSSGVLDPLIESQQKSTQTTDAQVSRIKARQWYWETYQHLRGGESVGLVYKYWVLVSVPDDEYDRVQAWKKAREENLRAEARQRSQMVQEFLQTTGSDSGAPQSALLVRTGCLPEVIAAARREGVETTLLAVRESLDARLAAALRKMLPFPVTAANLPTPLAAGEALSAEDLAQLRSTGAIYVFLPRLEGFGDQTRTTEYARISRIAHERQLSLSAALEVVDLASGEVLPGSAALRLMKSEASGMVLPGTPVALPRPPEEAAAAMAEELSRATAAAIGPPRILSVTGDQLLVDRGAAFGFAAGDTVEIFAARTARSPASGREFQEEYPVGRARIVRGDEQRCYARLLQATAPIGPGFVVRLLPPERAGTEGAAPGSSPSPGSSDRPVDWK